VLISAGEALSADLVSQWLRPGLRFYNGYGPTETACGVTLMELDATTLPPPLGRPMPNYRAYVLDRHLNPLPVGAIGELHIGGLCHAREYLNQPELTRQRFIRSPFDDDPAARLYKTGDLVRRQPDGNMQFIGRIDNQVKIRGLRIELGEIETALAAHPAVAQAHVITADDATGQKHLIGYARTDPDASVTPPTCASTSLASCPPTWSPPISSSWSDSHSLPTGRSTTRRCPARTVRPSTAPRPAP
jgi:acyl-coenzyme A synthetase/AMP-(fatty) acid ligase